MLTLGLKIVCKHLKWTRLFCRTGHQGPHCWKGGLINMFSQTIQHVRQILDASEKLMLNSKEPQGGGKAKLWKQKQKHATRELHKSSNYGGSCQCYHLHTSPPANSSKRVNKTLILKWSCTCFSAARLKVNIILRKHFSPFIRYSFKSKKRPDKNSS